MVSVKYRTTVESVIFDAFTTAGLFFFLSGAGFLFQGSLHELIEQRPWIHRIAVTAMPVVSLIWAALRSSELAGASRVIGSAEVLFKTPKRVLIGLYFYLALSWSWSSCLRHWALHTSFDFAIFVQAIWNTLHGNFLYSSIKGGICLLGDHFSPFLAVLALPYGMWPHPECLLVIQAFAAASIVFPVYKLVREKKPKGNAPLLFVLATALYLPLRNAVRFDFHPEVVTMPLLLWAFHFLTQKKNFKASLCMLAALSAKENTALVTAALGAYAFWGTPRSKLFGVVWMTASAAYFWIAVHWWVPYFSGGAPFAYLGGNFIAWHREGAGALAAHLFSFSTIAYLIKIFGPFAGLSFLSPPTAFLCMPMLAQNLLSRNEATRSIFFQYTALLSPFVIASSIEGWKTIAHFKKSSYGLMIAAVLFSGVSEFYIAETYAGQITPHTAAVSRYLRNLPPEASLRTHEFLAPHGAHRMQLHIYENNHPLEGGSRRAMSADVVVLDHLFLGGKDQDAFTKLENLGYYRVVFEDGLSVWKKIPATEEAGKL